MLGENTFEISNSKGNVQSSRLRSKQSLANPSAKRRSHDHTTAATIPHPNGITCTLRSEPHEQEQSTTCTLATIHAFILYHCMHGTGLPGIN